MKKIRTKLEKSFYWLNAAQFFGVLNDNIFKLLIIAFIIGPKDSESASDVTAIAGAVFVVPFLIFSALAGKLADRFSKRNITIATKAVEVLVMSLGLAAFLLEMWWALYLVLFLMASQSAFFSPSKYGIIPELVERDQLSHANSMIEGFTYLAIVIGSVFAPLILHLTNKQYGLAAAICVALAVLGLIASFFISRTKPSGSKRRASIFFVADIWRTLSSIRRKKDLVLAVAASAYFMLIGAYMQLNVIPFSMERLGFDETQGGYLFLPAAIGIGLGSLIAGKLSGRNVELGLVPLGSMGLMFSSMLLGVIQGGLLAVGSLLFLIGISAGLFVVPIRALIQLRSPRKRLGSIIAASSFLGWIGVLAASGLVYITSKLGLTASQGFMLLGVMTLILTVATVIILPDFLLRLIAFLLTRLLYRIRIKGLENVPTEGGCLLICNHVSWVDGLLLNATQQRHIRFLARRDYYNKWGLRWLFKLEKYIPISADDSPKQLIRAFREARAALDTGEIVCVFAEGAITRTGLMLGFRGGFERIVKGSDYPIIPVYLGGVWGSIFSYYYGKPLSTLPKKVPYPVTINFGKPMPTDTTAEQIRQRVSELSCEHYETLKRTQKSLADGFISIARKNRRRRCISDSSGKELNYSKTLVGSIALADKIAKLTQQQDNVGILLPPSAGGVLTNLAVTILGKVTVNLNYVASKEAREVAIQQCKLKTIISSRKFIEKLNNLADTENLVFLEDIVETIDVKAKLKAYFKAQLMPRRFIVRTRNFSSNDPVTIIYTSGSSGRPKGVMLSHNNIASNIEAARIVIRIRHNDDICGVLPLFHSFGYTATLWLPLLSGVSAVYIPNPLDGETVGKCVRQNKSTILFGTPTFLLNYVRKAEPDDFATLRSVVVGAEKLKPSVAEKFEKKFGKRPVEGYGATELSPVVSLNLPYLESGGTRQVVSKPGTVGKPIPGVTVQIVDVDSGQPLDIEQEGLVMVKGPNVMLGYLDMPEESAAVLNDGWYNTGDVGKLDADGFLTLTDRLSRFSKIGGEMVPHLAVEQAYLEALNTSEQVLAVTGIPDTKKGEQLVVLYLEQAGTAEKLHDIISACDVPNMWKPRRDNYVEIDSMPILGSGKLDIMQLRKTALATKSNN